MPIHEIDKSVFAERIKQLRIDNKLTQKQMAVKLGINERTYQHIEAGRYSPSYKTTISIINGFGMQAYNHLIAFEGFELPAEQ